MSTRRFFLKTAGTVAGTLSIAPVLAETAARDWKEMEKTIADIAPETLASDEDFWGWIKESYTVSPNLIELNNGGVSPQPKPVQDTHIRFYQYCNEAPSYYMWRQLDNGREPLREKLAELAGCSAEEIAINRNSTEGLNTVIFGLNLKAGDEVILNKYDYPNMMNAWKQREKRDGIKLVWLDMQMPIENDEEIVKLYTNAMTSKTKVVHLTHMINWTGQIMPVKKIADVAHAKGSEVIVDAAHSFAHVDFKVTDTGADYLATSLHKWMGAPFGSGMLYIKKDKIKNVWALLSNDKPDGDDIRKFETLGTRSFASEMAISSAIDFHNVIGSKRKEERLRYLKNYWCNKVKGISNLKLNTSLLPQYSCALAHFSIEGWKAEEMHKYLLEKKKIHTAAFEYEKLNGVRVTPNVYTTLRDLDKLVEGIEYMSKNAPAR